MDGSRRGTTCQHVISSMRVASVIFSNFIVGISISSLHSFHGSIICFPVGLLVSIRANLDFGRVNPLIGTTRITFAVDWWDLSLFFLPSKPTQEEEMLCGKCLCLIIVLIHSSAVWFCFAPPRESEARRDGIEQQKRTLSTFRMHATARHNNTYLDFKSVNQIIIIDKY